MKKFFRFIGMTSALLLSLFGTTACFGHRNVSLYGVPYMEEDGRYETNNPIMNTSGETINNNEIDNEYNKNSNNNNVENKILTPAKNDSGNSSI